MSRGVLFALNAEDGVQVAEAESDADVISVVERLEERWDGSWLEELDKAWDALHRCLSDGTLNEDGGDYPLSFAIFGGEPALDKHGYIVRYVDPEEVVAVSDALNSVDEQWLRQRYNTLAFIGYQGVRSEEDLAYTVASLPGLRSFYQRAAAAGRAVIFTVDQ